MSKPRMVYEQEGRTVLGFVLSPFKDFADKRRRVTSSVDVCEHQPRVGWKLEWIYSIIPCGVGSRDGGQQIRRL